MARKRNVLTKQQQEALQYVRDRAKISSEKAFNDLLSKWQELGYSEKQLHNVLEWIEKEAHLIIHVDLRDERVLPLLKDTDYRNQFETKTSRGTLSESFRLQWESNMFGTAYNNVIPYDRVKYGTINLMGDTRGMRGYNWRYGEAYLLLKNQIRKRVTCTNTDSSFENLEIGTLDHLCHILNKSSKDELQVIAEAAQLAAEGKDCIQHQRYVDSVCTYQEIQFHGPVLLHRDIEAVIAPAKWKEDYPATKKAILKFASKTGCKVVWFN